MKNNPNRVSLLERCKMNMLIKRLSLGQLYVLKELILQRIEKLERNLKL